MLNAEEIRRLEGIHEAVMKVFKGRSDMDKYRKFDHWVGPSDEWKGEAFEGDCDDVVLHFRRMCEDAGFQTRIVTCWVPLDTLSGQREAYHCVLECEGHILDNLQRPGYVPPRDRLPYRWHLVSGYEPGGKWREITG